MKVSLLYQNSCLPRGLQDDVAALVLRSDAGRGVVRVADIDQSFAGRRQHSWQVVTETTGQRNLNDFLLVNVRVVKDSFEGRIGNDQFSAAWPKLKRNAARGPVQGDSPVIAYGQRARKCLVSKL